MLRNGRRRRFFVREIFCENRVRTLFSQNNNSANLTSPEGSRADAMEAWAPSISKLVTSTIQEHTANLSDSWSNAVTTLVREVHGAHKAQLTKLEARIAELENASGKDYGDVPSATRRPECSRRPDPTCAEFLQMARLARLHVPYIRQPEPLLLAICDGSRLGNKLACMNRKHKNEAESINETACNNSSIVRLGAPPPTSLPK